MMSFLGYWLYCWRRVVCFWQQRKCRNCGWLLRGAMWDPDLPIHWWTETRICHADLTEIMFAAWPDDTVRGPERQKSEG